MDEFNNDDPEIWFEEYDPKEDLDSNSNNNEYINNQENRIIQIFLLQLFAFKSCFFISDDAIQSILQIVHLLLRQLETKLSISQLSSILSIFPSTLYMARKKIGVNETSSIKYVCCPTCSTNYDPDDCVTFVNGKKESKTCSYVRFPDHPQSRLREKCGTVLMKSFCSANGKTNYLYPKRVYCYQSLTNSIQNLINRIEIRNKLLEGPTKSTDNVMFDTVDGKFWTDFCEPDGKRYFSDKRNLGGILNIDWFEPFENVQYSCGVIYLALLNLLRELRFKWENVIVVGVIPGPKEPSLNVNSFLRPLVDELLTFWSPGVLLNENGSKAFYKFALCCISSDLPATRKCCGFVSYNANHG